MTKLELVHGPGVYSEDEAGNMVVGYCTALNGRLFDEIEYERPWNGKEQAYFDRSVRCRLKRGGTMYEVKGPA